MVVALGEGHKPCSLVKPDTQHAAVGGVIQIIASALELNISATHCIVGGISAPPCLIGGSSSLSVWLLTSSFLPVGFAMAYGGPNAVIWSRKAVTAPGQTPPLVPYTGCVPIFFAWRALVCSNTPAHSP